MRAGWGLAAVVATGCHVVFGVDPGGAFCERPEQADARLCADFDDPSLDDDPVNVLRQFVRDEARPGEHFEVELDAPRSAPRAARLRITGAGSPDAILRVPAGSATKIQVSMWARITGIDTNTVKLVRIPLVPEGNLELVSTGNLHEWVDPADTRSLAMFAPLPRNVWFEIALDVDLAAREGTARVHDESYDFMLEKSEVATGVQALWFGAFNPSPANSMDGWNVQYDDIVMRHDGL